MDTFFLEKSTERVGVKFHSAQKNYSLFFLK
jgi:hypothetical protein